MKKTLTWKQYLLIALICYGLNYLLGSVLPNLLGALLEIVGLITLILGIIGGVKAAMKKKS